MWRSKENASPEPLKVMPDQSPGVGTTDRLVNTMFEADVPVLDNLPDTVNPTPGANRNRAPGEMVSILPAATVRLLRTS